MAGSQDEIAEMFLQEHEKQSRSHREAVRKHREIILLILRMEGGIQRSGKTKTPRVRQHRWGKK